MAWSPQARAAAIAARKRNAHGPKIAMNGHHGIRGGNIQPVNQKGHHGKMIAKQALKGAAIGAVAGAAGIAAGAAYLHASNSALKKYESKQNAKKKPFDGDAAFRNAHNTAKNMRFGLSKKAIAHGKQAAAAKGTSGSSKRAFVTSKHGSTQVGGPKGNNPYHKLAPSSAMYHNAFKD